MSAFGVDFLGFCEGWKRGAAADLAYDENLSRYLLGASMTAYAEQPSQCDALAPVRRGEWEILDEFRSKFMSHEIYGFLMYDYSPPLLLLCRCHIDGILVPCWCHAGG